jgi:hypothetical protein
VPKAIPVLLRCLFALAMLLTLPAQACPAWEEVALRGINQTGDTLSAGRDYAVIAGGDQDLMGCGFPHRGYAMTRPDFEFHLTGMARYGRLILTVAGECDTLLLVNGTDGNWYFDASSYRGRPRIEFYRNLEGTYDIWVGTRGPQTCPAMLTLEAR